MKKSLFLFLAFSIFNAACAQSIVYFTGIGCPHCAKTDPIVFNLFNKYPNLTVIEYEIYQENINAPLLSKYCDLLGLARCGIPLVIFSNTSYLIGDLPIIQSIETYMDANSDNEFLLLNGSQSLLELNISSLPGKPKIWFKNGVLFKENDLWTLEWNGNESFYKIVPPELLSEIGDEYSLAEPEDLPISGGSISFENAVKVQIAGSGNYQASDLTLFKIITLALVDAVNPCALAVLALVLISIVTYNPKKKRNVLLAGFNFSLAVFIMYFFYGLVLIRFFQLVQALTSIRLFLYKALGFVALILGFFQIKDYFYYKPGGFATEMPMRLRPFAKKLINKVTSPKGAFIIGLFITVFLLPCTIGPYVITSGLLSAFELLSSIPYLIIYNMLFISPMVGITFAVYFGLSKAKDVKKWKDKNVKHLHLTAGLIITFLGLGMLLGWF